MAPDEVKSSIAQGCNSPIRHDRTWVNDAVRKIEAEANRSADTHLIAVPLPSQWNVDLYLKDESVHPTGSLKHRLARSLVLYGLCNGWIGPDTTLVEASSGSTAVSEAYFARLLGLPFVAVVPRATSPEKLEQIRFFGGECHLVDDPSEVDAEARRIAAGPGAHFLDQFTYAERATDWRGNNNIAESIFDQLTHERFPVPRWVVVGAGTGGTSATVGRFVRYRCLDTEVCVVDPEHSVYADAWDSGDHGLVDLRPGRIEGIGRPRVEASFVAEVVDRMIRVPDAASVAGARVLQRLIGRSVGASTGTNVWGAMHLVAEMVSEGQPGSVVSLICDPGTRYGHTIYDGAWLNDNGIDPEPYEAALTGFIETGVWAPNP